MSNSNKIILDLCGGTGSWSEPYKQAGYDVRLITLPEIAPCVL
jgi:ubiquinone/menaquinone biosynthesis C-methylase UbiE